MSDNPTIQWTLSSDEKWEDFQIIPTATRIEPKDHGTLFLYLDESGNFDFAKTGTPYFIMTCLVSRRPFKACHDLMDYKYDCFEQGVTLKKFHACDDNRTTRDAVYSIISNHQNRYAAYSIHVDKNNLPEELKDPGVLYANVFEWIMREVFSKEIDKTIKRVVVVTDDIPKEAKKRQIVKPLKSLIKHYAEQMGVEAKLEHYPSESDFNLQIADYACWAFMRKETGKGDRPYDGIERMFQETGHLRI